MKRRTLLGTAGIGLGPPFLGCLERVSLENGTDGPERDDREEGDADEKRKADATGAEPGTHHLYLENLDDDARRVGLEVVRRGDDDPVVEAAYDIPHERGAELRGVAAWGETYEVTASLEANVSATFCWEAEPCPGPEEAGAEAAELSDGSRNGSVRIEPGATDLSFVADSCDEIIAGTAVPIGSAEQFEVDEPTQGT